MSAIRIEATDDLRKIAFKVCTALHRVGSKVVLTGGSAATIYAPEAYQSRDVDFIVFVASDTVRFHKTIADLGFIEEGRVYSNPNVPVTLDFPDQDIRIGNELVERFATLEEDGLTLFVLTPTDCVRDRLASFFWFSDRSALSAACGVAIACVGDVDLDEIRAWAGREGEEEKFEEFIVRLEMK